MKTPSLNQDKPIKTLEEDLFGYHEFAKSFANILCTAKCDEGLVISLEGSWGSGKTSFINLVKDILNKQKNIPNIPDVMDFNPWWFHNKEALAYLFLNDLKNHLSKWNKWAKKELEALKDYADVIGSLAGVFTGVPVVGQATSTFLSRAARTLTIPELKTKINAQLAKKQQRIVVVIDDIDRLTPEEITEVLRVTKAVGDFNHIIYVLLFDSTVVIPAIEASLNGTNGAAYLEKIIQVNFALPRLHENQLVNIWSTCINEQGASQYQRPLTTYRDQFKYYEDIFTKLLKTPRDLLRLKNAFNTTFPALIGEVNPYDFSVLTYLRIFQNKIYQYITNHKELFTQDLTKLEEKIRETVTMLHTGDKKPNLTMELISLIFPKYRVGNIYDELSVRHPLYFDSYFKFYIPEDTLSQKERLQLVQQLKSTNLEESIQFLNNWKELPSSTAQSKLHEFMLDEQLSIFQNLLKRESEAKKILVNIFLRWTDEEWFNFTKYAFVGWISMPIKDLLKTIPKSEVFTILNTNIQHIQALYCFWTLLQQVKVTDNILDSSEVISLKHKFACHLSKQKSQALLNTHNFPEFAGQSLFWFKEDTDLKQKKILNIHLKKLVLSSLKQESQHLRESSFSFWDIVNLLDYWGETKVLQTAIRPLFDDFQFRKDRLGIDMVDTLTPDEAYKIFLVKARNMDSYPKKLIDDK